jgi:hypothetical protein
VHLELTRQFAIAAGASVPKTFAGRIEMSKLREHAISAAAIE